MQAGLLLDAGPPILGRLKDTEQPARVNEQNCVAESSYPGFSVSPPSHTWQRAPSALARTRIQALPRGRAMLRRSSVQAAVSTTSSSFHSTVAVGPKAAAGRIDFGVPATQGPDAVGFAGAAAELAVLAAGCRGALWATGAIGSVGVAAGGALGPQPQNVDKAHAAAAALRLRKLLLVLSFMVRSKRTLVVKPCTPSCWESDR